VREYRDNQTFCFTQAETTTAWNSAGMLALEAPDGVKLIKSSSKTIV
jgi:hypothetical protein